VRAICSDAAARLKLHIDNGTVRHVIDGLVEEVDRHDHGLSADLRHLLAVLVSHLEQRIGDASQQMSVMSEAEWDSYEDPLETDFQFAMWDDEADEARLREYGPRALLEVVRAKESDNNGRWFTASLVTREGETLPDTPQVNRYVPKGAVSFRGRPIEIGGILTTRWRSGIGCH
jgi:hypothetical protein